MANYPVYKIARNVVWIASLLAAVLVHAACENPVAPSQPIVAERPQPKPEPKPEPAPKPKPEPKPEPTPEPEPAPEPTPEPPPPQPEPEPVPQPPPAPAPQPGIVVVGDSLASGGLTGALRGACGCEVLDRAVPGQFLLGGYASAALSEAAGKDVVIWLGVNDLNAPGSQSGQVLSALGALIAQARSAGARHVALLPYPPVFEADGRPRDRADVDAANAGLPSLGALMPVREIPASAVVGDGLHVSGSLYPSLASAIVSAFR